MAVPGQWPGLRSRAVSVTPSPSGCDTPSVGSESVPSTTSGVVAYASAGAGAGTGSTTAVVVVDSSRVEGTAHVDGTGFSWAGTLPAAVRETSGPGSEPPDVNAQPPTPRLATTTAATAATRFRPRPSRAIRFFVAAEVCTRSPTVVVTPRTAMASSAASSAAGAAGVAEHPGRRLATAPDAGRDAHAAGPGAGDRQARRRLREVGLDALDGVEVTGPGLRERSRPAAHPHGRGTAPQLHRGREVLEHGADQ